MAALFHLSIVLPAKSVFEGDISSLTIPAELGYMGILAHHAPIIARLAPGKIRLRDSSGKESEMTSVGRGFLEFSDNRATLMVDSLEQPA